MLLLCGSEMERGINEQGCEYDRGEPESFFLNNPREICDKKKKCED
jgi:hypothetical protein